MPDPIILTFGNMPILRARMLHVSGGTPSQCWVTSLRDEAYPDQGDLVFQQGATGITFRDCRVKHSYTEQTGRFVRWRHVIEDRRWRWRDADVSGDFNFRATSGEIKRKKNAQELFGLVLDQLGETGYNVAGVPTDIYPTCHWNSAALAIDQLCQRTNCRLSLNLDNSISVVRRVAGVAPDSALARWQILKTRDRPRYLELRLKPTVFEALLTFEAVGVEPSGTLFPEVNKAPKIIPVRDMKNYVGLARCTVGSGLWNRTPLIYRHDHGQIDRWLWRMWRVTLKDPVTATVMTVIPGTSVPITSIDQIELRNDQCYNLAALMKVDPLSDFDAPGDISLLTRSYGSGIANPTPSIDSVDGQLLFTDRPCYRTTITAQSDSTPEGYLREPRLRAHVAYNAKDQYGRLIRRSVIRDLGGTSTATKVIHCDLYQTIRNQTPPVGGDAFRELTSSGVTIRNDNDINPELTRILDEAQASLGPGEAWDVGYIGLLPINIDSSVAQVEWMMSSLERGYTRIGVNEEFDDVYPSELLRMENSHLREVVR